MCVHSYTVEELHFFKKYYDYLLQISELCADGYVLKKSDKDFFKKSTQAEVDRFIQHIKNTRKKKKDYTRPIKNQLINNNKSKNNTLESEVKNTDDFEQSKKNADKEKSISINKIAWFSSNNY